MNLDSALQTFIIEARELLQEMEAALLRLEHEPADADTVNAIFRAAHTIKGSAGLFGLDPVVSFTHVVESVLDKVRGGELSIDGDLASLFLDSCDQISALVELVTGGGGDESALAGKSAALIDKLNVYLGKQPVTVAAAASTPVVVAAAGAGPLAVSDHWHLSLRFGPDVLRNGMDPLSFLRYLKTLGDITAITTITDALPAAAEMDPESCYLGFEVAFRSDADKAAIEGVFEFVRDDAQIHILPPRSRIAEYVELIRAMPGDEMKLGEILIKCGTLTEQELRDGLSEQRGAAQPEPIGQILVESGSVQPQVVEAALQKQQQVKNAKTKQQTFVRVDADKLDQLINLVGELVIAGAGASVLAHRTGVAEMIESTTAIGEFIEQVRDSALSLRMVQIGETFSRFTRVVRDVSKELGKEINLEISGADTELDKTVVEKIGDPLMHLVRNSMDHGIEKDVALRRERGKPAHGTIRLNAYHDSGSIVIEVSDDGGGLNRERILAKAIEKGLVSPGQQLSDSEIYKLIFAAGFSTAEQVTNLSGRGVGMDVVRKNIEALRGSIDIDSVPGKGSVTRIRLPLTLAIIDGFLIGVNRSTFVIPLDAVVECIEMDNASRDDEECSYINLRGEVLPYVRLRDIFELGGQPGARENIVVIQYAGRKAGLVVDELMGEFQTVIKPLGKIFSHIRGLGGSTILGSGEVALILDVQGVISQVLQREPKAVAAR